MILMDRRIAWFAALVAAFAGLWACRQSQEPDFPIEYTLGKGAGPAASAPPPSLAGDVRADEKKEAFDEAQAKIVLNRAANNARSCVNVVGQNQAHGDVTVTVTFSGTGKSTKATIGPPFEGKPFGNCVVRAFVNIMIKPFEGADVEMKQKVILRGGGAK
jgi:hypothetical protein